MLRMGHFCQLRGLCVVFIYILSAPCDGFAHVPTGAGRLPVLRSSISSRPVIQHKNSRPGCMKTMGRASASARSYITLSATEWLAASSAGSSIPETASLEAFQKEAESGQKLGLLPFGVADAMLPGETKQVHLYEARFTHLFESATRNHGCLGQLLVTRDGGVAAVTSLLEVEESRRQDIGVWAQLKCVARVRLTSLEQTEYDYFVGDVDMVTDARDCAKPNSPSHAVAICEDESGRDVGDREVGRESDREIGREIDGETDCEAGLEEEDEEEREAERAAEELRKAHRSCRRLALACKQLADEDDGADAVTQERSSLPRDRHQTEGLCGYMLKEGSDDQLTELVQWGHEARREALPFESAIDDVVALRRDAILSRGPDAAPAPSLMEQVRILWGVDTEAQAERQLLSFAATGFLSPAERAEALGMRDTVQRLQHVLTFAT